MGESGAVCWPPTRVLFIEATPVPHDFSDTQNGELLPCSQELLPCS